MGNVGPVYVLHESQEVCLKMKISWSNLNKFDNSGVKLTCQRYVGLQLKLWVTMWDLSMYSLQFQTFGLKVKTSSSKGHKSEMLTCRSAAKAMAGGGGTSTCTPQMQS
jgi:hypothetical protein